MEDSALAAHPAWLALAPCRPRQRAGAPFAQGSSAAWTARRSAHAWWCMSPDGGIHTHSGSDNALIQGSGAGNRAITGDDAGSTERCYRLFL